MDETAERGVDSAASRPQSVAYWQRQIRRGLSHRREKAGDADWSTWEDYYEFRHPGARLSMNYTFALIRGMVPRVYFKNPRVTVRGRYPGLAGLARINERVANWLAGPMGLAWQMKRAILHAGLYGTGIVKMGYDSPSPVREEDFLGVVETPEGVADLRHETLRQYDRRTMERIAYHQNVRPGLPWALAVHPRDVVIDPDCEDVRGARWVAHRFRRNHLDALADEGWDTRGLQPTHQTDSAKLEDGESGAPNDPRYEDPTTRVVELWEVSDLKTQKVFIVGLDHDRFVYEAEDPLLASGLNYQFVVFNDRPNSPWGISDVQVVHQQQMELNSVREAQKAYRILHKLRLLMRKGALSKEQLDKLSSGDFVGVLEVDDDARQPLKDLMAPLNFSMPADLSGWARELRDDMSELAGLGRNQMGMFAQGSQGGAGRATATEASIVQANSEIRVDERRVVVAEVYTAVMRRALQCVWSFWESPQVARVSGPDGALYWVQYTGREIRGEYDLEVEAEDAALLTREVRRAQANDAFDRLVGLPPELVRHDELVRQWVEGYEFLDADRLLQAPAGLAGPMGAGEFAQMYEGGGPGVGPEGGAPLLDMVPAGM